MQITTLMQAPLTLASVQYKREGLQANPNAFTIKITTTAPHGIYGSVKIQLANVVNVNVDGVANYFNTQLLPFTRTGANTLETTINWGEGSFDNQKNTMNYNNTTNFITLPNNGSPITTLVNNTVLNIEGVNEVEYMFADNISVSGGATNPVGAHAPHNECRMRISNYYTDPTGVEILSSQNYGKTQDEIKAWRDIYPIQYATLIATGRNNGFRFALHDQTENTRIVIVFKTK